MSRIKKILLTALILVCFGNICSAQMDTDILIKRMQQHESNILLMYLEYQKLYYEDKSRIHELKAFENLLSVYINQVMEIYETLNLSVKKTNAPRDISSRALVFKALMFLEKAPLNNEFFEKACYEYYEALSLYEETDSAPVVYKDLPQHIIAGNKTYYRLKDLLDDKGKNLTDFGKVTLSFRNFMVTANFAPEMLELVKVKSEESPAVDAYTYNLAEERIKLAFNEVFQKGREVQTYVALPYGTYVLRLHGGSKSEFTALTRFYVRPNQEQHYVMEPLADWIVLYENPNSKRPDYYKFSRNKSSLFADSGLPNSFISQTNGTQKNESSNNVSAESPGMSNHEKLVSEIVSEYLPQYKIKLMFDLNDPEIKENAIQIISKAIVEYVESPSFYNKWNHWSSSWDISNKVREIISPGSLVPIELVELVHKVILEL